MSDSSSSAPPAGTGTTLGLSPGIYVAAREISGGGLGSFGAHQFVFAIPSGRVFSHEVTQAGHQVLIWGAYNQTGRLIPSINAPSDLAALGNHLRGLGTLDVAPVSYLSVDPGIDELMLGYGHYLIYEAAHTIAYPASGGMTMRGCETSTTYNSNSWAQSLVEHRLGAGLVREDFDGIDICHENRIPSAYFK